MRIVHVTSDAGIGGAGRHVHSLLEAPVWRDDELTVIAPPGALADWLRAESRGRWRTETFDHPGAARSFHPGAVLPLARRLRARRPDVVHAHASLSARLAARAARVPAVLHTRHGSSRRESAQWAGGRLRTLRTAAERLLADDAVAVSRAVADELRADGAPAARIHLVPVGVDPGPIREASARRDAWRERLGAGDGEVVVVGTGRLVPEKSWEDWIAVAGAVAARPAGRAARFFIAGDGPERPRLTSLVREAGLPEETLLGFTDDVPGLLAAADAFMLLSRSEGLALAVLEAMHAGLPVVATAAGGLAEAVRDGETGRVVPVGDRRAAEAALAEILGDPDARAAMGRAGRELAAARFTAERMAADLRRLYADLLRGRG